MSKIAAVHTPEVVIAHAVPEEARAANTVAADGRADYALYVPPRAQEGWVSAIRAELITDDQVRECARRKILW